MSLMSHLTTIVLFLFFLKVLEESLYPRWLLKKAQSALYKCFKWIWLLKLWVDVQVVRFFLVFFFH